MYKIINYKKCMIKIMRTNKNNKSTKRELNKKINHSKL